MGVDFSHGDASWAYSGFNRFRTRLASEIGMELEKMEGFGGDTPWGNYADDILPFLNHSDCDGELSPEECAKIAPRIRALVASWPEDYDHQKALRLADGMEEAANAQETFEFM